MVSKSTDIKFQAAPGSIPSIPATFSEEDIVDVADVNQWHCIEESGQWLENVDQTHLVLAKSKLVLENFSRINLNPYNSEVQVFLDEKMRIKGKTRVAI